MLGFKFKAEFWCWNFQAHSQPRGWYHCKTPTSTRVLMSYLGDGAGKTGLSLGVTVPALSLPFRYETRRSPSSGTLSESSSTWTAATFILPSSAASIMKQKCWTQQWWAQRSFKSEPLIRTRELMLKSTTPFRQVRAMQQDSSRYDRTCITILYLVATSPSFSSCCKEQQMAAQF